MLNEQFKIFKSGTDIRGVASEGVEGQSVNLTDEMVYKMADGFGFQRSFQRMQKTSQSPLDVTAVFQALVLWLPLQRHLQTTA